MATLIAKTYIIPAIASVRLTCAGTQYTVVTPEYTDVVTVNGAHIACTCCSGHCNHIRVVELQRSRDAQADSQRAAYEATFDLNYAA
jgi:hypothetical protein